MTQKFTQFFWVDAVSDLARREEVATRMQSQDRHASTTLYVLPSTLPKICSVYRPGITSTKHKALLVRVDHTCEFGCQNPRVVDLATALSAFWSAKSTMTVRALANAYDTATEIDIVAIEPAYLADPETAVNEYK